MHVLIIPSEEFIPPKSHLAGIFQFHQAIALKEAGCKVGVLSVSQSLSVFMIMRALINKLLIRNSFNELKKLSFLKICILLWDKIFRVEKFISKEFLHDFLVYRIDGFYYLPPSKHTNHFGWINAGKKCFSQYVLDNGFPDIIHAHNGVYAGLLAYKLSLKYKINFFITEHSSFIARGLESKYLYKKLINAYTNSSKLYVVSDFLGHCMDQVFKTKLPWQVMPNVLDPLVENFIQHKITKQDGTFKFISIGSLIHLKRHGDIIKAFSQVYSKQNNIQLHIAGDGELSNQLNELIIQYELRNQIKLVGQLNRIEIIELISTCDCLILSSELETFGVVLIEALALGKPVIASKCGGPESIVDSTNGILYETADIESLSSAILKVIHSYDYFDASKISSEAKCKYGQAYIGSKLLKAYEQILL